MPKIQQTQGIQYFVSFNAEASTSVEIGVKLQFCFANGQKYIEKLCDM